MFVFFFVTEQQWRHAHGGALFCPHEKRALWSDRQAGLNQRAEILLHHLGLRQGVGLFLLLLLFLFLAGFVSVPFSQVVDWSFLFSSLLFFEPWQGLHGRHERSLSAALQHIKKSKTVSTSTASLPGADKINKNVFHRPLRKRGFKLTDVLLHPPGLVIDVSWHAKSQTCGTSSHRDTAGSSVHKSSGCKGSGDPGRRTRSRIAQQPRQRRHRMPNLRSIALNPTEIKPLQFGSVLGPMFHRLRSKRRFTPTDAAAHRLAAPTETSSPAKSQFVSS